MSMQANNIVITGGNFNQNNYSNTALVIQKLYEHRVATGAFYNSEERLEEADLKTVNIIARRWMERLSIPREFPSILDQLPVEDAIKDIVIWLQDQDTNRRILWLYDDDRRLSALISQIVAEILAKRGGLGAAYFFPDTAPGKSGADASRIIPTIAYQLTRNVPGAATHIADTIVHDLEIFDLNVYEQVTKLLVEPLKQAYQASGSPEGASSALSKPIIIHGFEGCENANFLPLFLDAFVHAWESTDSENGIPFLQKLLILGRPTVHFRECLGKLREGLLLRRSIRIQSWHEREEEICRREQESRKKEEALKKELQQLEKELKKQLEEVRYERKTEIVQSTGMDERQWKVDKSMGGVLQHVGATRFERKSLRSSSINDSGLTEQVQLLSVERTELLNRLTILEKALKTVALAVESSPRERDVLAARNPHTMLPKHNKPGPPAPPARVSTEGLSVRRKNERFNSDSASELVGKEKERHEKVFKRYAVIIPDERRHLPLESYASSSRQRRDDPESRSAYLPRPNLSEEFESEYCPRRKVILNYESETDGRRRQVNLSDESDSDSPSTARLLTSRRRRHGLHSSEALTNLRAKRDIHLSSSRLASISERLAHMPTSNTGKPSGSTQSSRTLSSEVIGEPRASLNQKIVKSRHLSFSRSREGSFEILSRLDRDDRMGTFRPVPITDGNVN